MPTTQTGTTRNLEDFAVIWLDATLKNKEIADYVIKEVLDLRRVVNYLKIFVDTESCLQYLMDSQIGDEKLFIVVSGTLGQQFVPVVHSTITAIHSIYVFCSYVEKHEKWAKSFAKIRGVYNDMKPICEQLRRDRDQCSSELLKISISSSKEKAAAAYLRLLADLEFIDTEQNKMDLIDECRQQYVDNEPNLKTIEEFATCYRSDQAIWWFKRTDLFLYRILDKALRIQDKPFLLHKLGFFIKDLHQQQLLQQAARCQPLTVYKGLHLSVEDFGNLQQNEFFSVENILSANTNSMEEQAFAARPVTGMDTVAVVLIIPTMVTDTQHQEITFPLGTVFRTQTPETLENSGVTSIRMQTLLL